MGSSASDLSSADMQHLRSNTRFSSAEIKDMYDKFKYDFPEGVITKPRFIDMYRTMFPEGDAAAFARIIFDAYDTDGNGVIDFHEFMCTLSVSSKGTVEERLQWAFRLYDLDKNGYVSRDEAVEMISAIYRMRGVPEARDKAEEAAMQLFIYLDKNKDDCLSEKEFISAVQGSKAVREMVQGCS